MTTLDHGDIAQLPVSTRTRNALRRAGIATVVELVRQPERRLLLLRHFGVGSLDELKAALTACGLVLAKEPPRPPP